MKDILQNKFHSTWKDTANNSSKLQFYTSVKKDVSFEQYLNIDNHQVRKSVARLRSSSHRLNIETARYQELSSKRGPRNKKCDASVSKDWDRSCKDCCDKNVELLQQLPFAETPIFEDERHVLATCPTYHNLRLQLSDHVKSSLLAWDERVPALFEGPAVLELGLFIHKIFQIRFPKKKNEGALVTTTSTIPPNIPPVMDSGS